MDFRIRLTSRWSLSPLSISRLEPRFGAGSVQGLGRFADEPVAVEPETGQLQVGREARERRDAAPAPQKAVEHLQENAVGDDEDVPPPIALEQEAPQLFGPFPNVFEGLAALRIDRVQVLSDFD